MSSPSLSSMLTHKIFVSGHHHNRGWLETPDGRHVQPSASKVKFISDLDKPWIAGIKPARRWWAKLMGIFA
ncbi:phage filamentation protein Fil family protein [Pragia fontium]|uniref:Uncharacterized protein n=1 Tax=Pragia fontium DSM 5563 = ATCC 49100 TaxID=1122977 RepID=A0AAJ4W9G5_9GAMM|nr:phage filamentation protein Fil family protein [Pragia fontium]SFC48776.1 hypothetical protein SAMN02745723_102488 [Pragia fontium DSM 5563 = ATCC 49100]